MFRSRLEARWSVLFDVIGLKYDYEPEGFVLAGDVPYLPDFYFPQIGWFGEIKPNFEAFDGKAFSFTRTTGYPILLLDGTPELRGYAGLQRFDEQVESIDFSLDIHSYAAAFAERRLWSEPDYSLMVTNPEEGAGWFSIRYRAGVEAARMAQFSSGKEGR